MIQHEGNPTRKSLQTLGITALLSTVGLCLFVAGYETVPASASLKALGLGTCVLGLLLIGIVLDLRKDQAVLARHRGKIPAEVWAELETFLTRVQQDPPVPFDLLQTEAQVLKDRLGDEVFHQAMDTHSVVGPLIRARSAARFDFACAAACLSGAFVALFFWQDLAAILDMPGDPFRFVVPAAALLACLTPAGLFLKQWSSRRYDEAELLRRGIVHLPLPAGQAPEAPQAEGRH